MLVYLISSKSENERISHIAYLEKLCKGIVHIDAVYPNKTPVPFYDKIKEVSKKRFGVALSDGAIGCLMSHRKTWRNFLNQSSFEHCLILESDSKIVDWDTIKQQAPLIANKYDIFFWGAFDGRMKIFKSTKVKMKHYSIGKPLINSLYCTYGYMINKKTAKYLLNQTNKFNYPVDYWKLRFKNSNLIIGGVIPNLITTQKSFKSTIDKKKDNLFNNIFDFIIDFKNTIITYFN